MHRLHVPTHGAHAHADAGKEAQHKAGCKHQRMSVKAAERHDVEDACQHADLNNHLLHTCQFFRCWRCVEIMPHIQSMDIVPC